MCSLSSWSTRPVSALGCDGFCGHRDTPEQIRMPIAETQREHLLRF